MSMKTIIWKLYTGLKTPHIPKTTHTPKSPLTPGSNNPLKFTYPYTLHIDLQNLTLVTLPRSHTLYTNIYFPSSSYTLIPLEKLYVQSVHGHFSGNRTIYLIEFHSINNENVWLKIRSWKSCQLWIFEKLDFMPQCTRLCNSCVS